MPDGYEGVVGWLARFGAEGEGGVVDGGGLEGIFGEVLGEFCGS